MSDEPKDAKRVRPTVVDPRDAEALQQRRRKLTYSPSNPFHVDRVVKRQTPKSAFLKKLEKTQRDGVAAATGGIPISSSTSDAELKRIADSIEKRVITKVVSFTRGRRDG